MRVAFDDGSALEIALELVERAGLGAGDPVDCALAARLADEDMIWRARETALDLLTHRPRSRAEVRRRLRGDGFPAAVAEACLASLVAAGLLDDRAFADAFVRDRLRLKPKGSARLRHELRTRGVDDAVAEEAVRAGLESVQATDVTLAAAIALRWLAGGGARERTALASPRFGEDREAALRRLIAYLKRRGFGGEAIRRALETVDREVERAPT